MATYNLAKWERLKDALQEKISSYDPCPYGSVGKEKQEVYKKVQKMMDKIEDES